MHENLNHDFKNFLKTRYRDTTKKYSSNFTPQVKQARNQWQIFNRKSISRNTTHRQSLHFIQIEDSI